MCTNNEFLIANKYCDKFKHLFEENSKEKRLNTQSEINKLKSQGIPDKNWQQIQLTCRKSRSKLDNYKPNPVFPGKIDNVPVEYVPVILDYIIHPSVVVVFAILIYILGIGFLILRFLIFKQNTKKITNH